MREIPALAADNAMPKRAYRNRLNDLTNKEWIKFQKSWFIHNPPPRRKDVRRHPAKFPETMAEEFIRFFTKAGQVVLDPMAGTGSTVIAALRSGRQGIGIELNPEYAGIAAKLAEAEAQTLEGDIQDLRWQIVRGDAADFSGLAEAHGFPEIDYVLTSPPYWNMLHASGSETQRARRNEDGLDVVYSDSEADLGNEPDYGIFLDRLVGVYTGLKPFLKPKAYLTIIVKNVKKGGRIYPLAWDLGNRLDGIFRLKDEKIWLQDNQRLAPYGMGNAWVSNTFHHYCLQFRNE